MHLKAIKHSVFWYAKNYENQFKFIKVLEHFLDDVFFLTRESVAAEVVGNESRTGSITRLSSRYGQLHITRLCLSC